MFIVGGGYLGHVILAQEDNGFGVKFEQDNYNNFDRGLIIGLEYQFKFGLFIESRYLYGLSDISKYESAVYNTEWVYKNRVVQLGLGYSF